MGLHKVSSRVEKKVSKPESLKNLVFGDLNEEDKKSSTGGPGCLAAEKGKLKPPVNSGPAQKKGSSKSTVREKSVKEKLTISPNAKQGGAKSEMKQQSKTKAGSANKKAGVLLAGRGHLETSGDTVCREVACEGLATSGGYCRLHYIKNWKKIKRKEVILREKKLNQYIEELVAKYPDKYIEAIRQDLANDKDFAKVIYDLDLDEGVDDFDVEGSDSVDSLIDTIKRDFDDEGEGF